MQKERAKKEWSIPFCVPLILEALVPTTFLSGFWERAFLPRSWKKGTRSGTRFFWIRSCNTLKMSKNIEFRSQLCQVLFASVFWIKGKTLKVKKISSITYPLKLFSEKGMHSKYQKVRISNQSRNDVFASFGKT